ncbi:hypothetical protein [Nitrosococcus oceani]|uniref:Uncharacterized protein n=1 Tax=Nitrosococcus oceani C-27 TaxID=314279 RepID=A0A0E2Z0Y6_9GAMM|nr:hypothetical protein [Nitrosococcus oceani]EDZ68470.1 hypothetical protein NOC27_1797 [Nitrosococcus oceani AFC27]KFI18891.1 hypothetical protein IB75_11360 [Nitrosococcus oceani C-27]KFI22167.1 hypothetical protein HW44_10835 [Nitrosococcus oceani]GEM19710.1 hypothetical protein NONS58_11050 [Nitrosococcus oceani]
MTKNEDLIDELCAELRQLYTELEKVKAVSEQKENCGRSIPGNIRMKSVNPTINKNKDLRKIKPAR